MTRGSSAEPAGVPDAEADRLLVAEEVAEMLAVPTTWVREATRSGRLPHLRLGRYVRYERAAIRAWMAEQQGSFTGMR